MNRRHFLKMAGAGMAGVMLPGIAKGSGEAAATDEKPNLLVIMTDEFNFRTLGCYRSLLMDKQAHIWGPEAVVETPHIDSLARRGALCNRFYCASPVCTPSRASFFTGLYPQSTGADLPNAALRDDMVTFAKVLRKKGYSTGYAGKWHLDGEGKPGWAPQRNFGFTDNTYMFNRGHWKMLEDTENGPEVASRDATSGAPDYGLEGADEQSYTTDFLADKTVDFIRAHQDTPFCFVLSIPDPHTPTTVRAPYDTMYLGMPVEKPKTAPADGEFDDMAQYFGMIKCIDDNVGKILEALSASGVAKRTIVVFTADHGNMCGQHGRTGKGFAFEDSARIPFLIKCPSQIRPLTIVSEAMNSTDFKPTILSLMGIADTGGNHGRDQSALLKGAARTASPRITFSRNAFGNWLMAADSRYKLIVNKQWDPEFFDTIKDSSETKNLVYEESSHENIRRLATALLRYCARCKEPNAADPRIWASMQWAAEEEWRPYSWHPPRWA